MNPNAKEFVPAHILKKRQDEETEAKRMVELTEKLDGVNLDKELQKPAENGDSMKSQQVQEKKDGLIDSSPNEQQRQLKGSGDENERIPQKNSSPNQDRSSTSRNHYRRAGENHHHINSNNQHHINNHYSNGGIHDLDHGDDDRFLLKAGENLCEFNGEEFIVPGDDDEYEGEISNPGYDFGNAEDNEDEDIANAFEEFLDNLPE